MADATLLPAGGFFRRAYRASWAARPKGRGRKLSRLLRDGLLSVVGCFSAHGAHGAMQMAIRLLHHERNEPGSPGQRSSVFTGDVVFGSWPRRYNVWDVSREQQPSVAHTSGRRYPGLPSLLAWHASMRGTRKDSSRQWQFNAQQVTTTSPCSPSGPSMILAGLGNPRRERSRVGLACPALMGWDGHHGMNGCRPSKARWKRRPHREYTGS